METDNKAIGKNILCDVKKAIENFDHSTNNEAIWQQFLKLQLIREIIVTGKQK